MTLESLRWAARAIRNEIVRFRFGYPLEIVPAAGPKDSLHYYIYSDSLSWSCMKLDANGIPLYCNRVIGESYHPAYIAWYGLVNLGHHLRRQDQASLNTFLNQVCWLEDHAVRWSDGAVVWPVPYDWQEGKTMLKAPWISAYVQGLGISALVRGWRVTGRRKILELLSKSTAIFEINVSRSGVRDVVGDHVLYAEYPGSRPPGPLDGLMTCLLGLYDLFMETGDGAVERLFTQGLDGLKYLLPNWDYRKKWSWYSSREYLCPPAYHNLNRVLLAVLARLTKEPTLAEYAERWDPARLTPTGRMEVFSLFVLTKNVCRVKHQTWRQKTAPASELAPTTDSIETQSYPLQKTQAVVARTKAGVAAHHD